MEYDRKRGRTRWTHVALYLLYAAAVIYLLMNNNRYLYSHRELRLALAGEHVDAVSPIPKGVPSAKGNGDPTYWARSNPERSNHDISGQTHDKDYVSEWQKDVLADAEEGDVAGWAADSSGVFVTGKHPWAIAMSPEGNLRWRFRFAKSPTEPGLLDPVTDAVSVYLAKPTGQIAAVDKETGKLLWKLNLASEIASSPIIIGNDLWMIIKPLETEAKRLEDLATETKQVKTKPQPNPAQHRFVKVDRVTGELKDYSNLILINGMATLTWSRELKQLLATNDNKLHSLNLDDGKSITTQTMPDPIKGAAVVAEGKVYVALSSGKIQSWDLGKKGKFEWEVDLDSPPQGPPTYVPTFQRLSVLTADGNLHMIDLKKAERLWKFQLENRNPTREVWAARLSGRFIERLGMKWEKKGWTIWAPCSENRLCIYNPDKGQLLARVPAPGGVLTPPLFVGKDFFLITSEKKGEKRNFRLSHYMDEDGFKKKQAAAKAEPPTSEAPKSP